MGSVEWGTEIAEVYDVISAATFDPAVLDPVVAMLAELAGGGHALEFAVATEGQRCVVRHLDHRGVKEAPRTITLTPDDRRRVLSETQLFNRPETDTVGIWLRRRDRGRLRQR